MGEPPADALRALVEEHDDGTVLPVEARPGASKSRLLGVHDGALRVAVAAPAREGRANRELTRYLARVLGLRPRHLAILSGERGRRKRLHVREVVPDDVAEALRRATEG